jgi:predicted transcriptional regulator of viral defense system
VHPELAALAAERLGVFTSQEALRVGYRVEDIRAELGRRRWTRLRKGVYAETRAILEADSDRRHLLSCVAVLMSLDPGPVLSHASAARLHGLVVPRSAGSDVRVTDVEQWRRGKGYRVARAVMPAADVVPWLAFGATSVPRTVVDCAREWSLTDGVIAMDAALNKKKAARTDLAAAVLAATHRVGIATAARAYGLCDGRAESPLETRGRLAIRRSGLPVPELQVEIWDEEGLIGRVDGWYDDAAVALEFDGKVKYTDPLYDESPAEAAWREKRREDRIRALDIRTVRIVNDDLGDPWPRMAGRIGQLIETRPLQRRRFRLVRTPEPGGAAVAA